MIFRHPDGTYTNSLVVTTTKPERFTYGRFPEGSSYLEVRFPGGVFRSDSTQVSTVGTEWVAPNPEFYPRGWWFSAGDSEVSVRAVYPDGTRGAEFTAKITVSTGSISEFLPPTGLTVDRKGSSVVLSVKGVSDPKVVGYNFYASTESGGGSSGYSRINLYPITQTTDLLSEQPLSSLVVDTVRGSDPTVSARVRVDNVGAEVQSSLDESFDILDTISEYRTSVSISRLERSKVVTFEHSRVADTTGPVPTIFYGDFASIPSDQPLYYVATAIYYDPESGVEYESYYSTESVGSPSPLRSATVGLPPVSRQDVVQSLVSTLYRQHPQLSVHPGSSVRDTLLDPLASEIERVRVVVDFLHRSSSFESLLEIDDPEGSGVSVPPSQSAYKTALASALYLANPNDVQTIIDQSFDKIASNFGIPRPSGDLSSGFVRFYTTTTPTRSTNFQLGLLVSSGSLQYRTTRSAEVPLGLLPSFWDPSTRQYNVLVPVQAVSVGESFNLDRGQIRSGAPYGWSVTNDQPLSGGKSRYTNAEFARFVQDLVRGKDPTLSQGLVRLASVKGVSEVSVVRSGDPQLVRDVIDGEHRGGRSDVWVRGSSPSIVKDSFTFRSQTKRGIRARPLNTKGLFEFDTKDLGGGSLASILDYPDFGLGLRNLTTGMSFDLTGVVITGPKTLLLSSDVYQPPYNLTDVVLADVRTTVSGSHVFSYQPVLSITSLVSDTTGEVSPSSYYLQRSDTPLGVSGSVDAMDSIVVTDSSIPGSPVSVSEEPHVLTATYAVPLNRLGADIYSVRVMDSEGVITYRGPWSTEGAPDYEIQGPSEGDVVSIRRTPDSRIQSGATVYVAYVCSDTYTVTYVTDTLPSQIQQKIDSASGTSSVKSQGSRYGALVKGKVQVPIDIGVEVVLSQGSSKSLVDRSIRSSLQYLLAGPCKRDLPRSRVFADLSKISGVDRIRTPLLKLCKSVGSRVSFDPVPVSGAIYVREWSTNRVSVWYLPGPLSYTPGVRLGEVSALYRNGSPMEIGSPDSSMGSKSGLFSFLSASSAVPGTSGDVSRGLLVSLSPDEGEPKGDFHACYIVGESSGESDLVASDNEFFVIGDLTLVYSEAP